MYQQREKIASRNSVGTSSSNQLLSDEVKIPYQQLIDIHAPIKERGVISIAALKNQREWV